MGNSFSQTLQMLFCHSKAALAAALCLYFLIADGEDGAEVDLAANSKE